jgi:hypothetical protein
MAKAPTNALTTKKAKAKTRAKAKVKARIRKANEHGRK